MNLKYYAIIAGVMLTSCLSDCSACVEDCEESCYVECGVESSIPLTSLEDVYCVRTCGWENCGTTINPPVEYPDASIEDSGENPDAEINDAGIHDTGTDASIPCGQMCAELCAGDSACFTSCLQSMCSGG